MSKKLIVTVSDELFATIGKLANNMGVSFPEYIRHLILKEKEKEQDKESRL